MIGETNKKARLFHLLKFPEQKRKNIKYQPDNLIRVSLTTQIFLFLLIEKDYWNVN